MTTGTYRGERGYFERPYSEKQYFLNDRFYPGELGMVALLGVAAILVWSLAIYGIFADRRPSLAYEMGGGAQTAATDVNAIPPSGAY